MNFVSEEKRKWLFSLFLFFISFVILFLNDSIAYDVIKAKKEYWFYNALFFFLLFLLLSTISFYQHWKQQKIHKKLLLLGIAAIFMSVNLVTHITFQASIFFVVVVLIYVWKEKKIYRPNTFSLLLIGYSLINILSLIWTIDFSSGIKLFGNISPLMFIPLLFCCFQLDEEDYQTLVFFLFRVSLFFIFLTIATWLLQSRAINVTLQENLTLEKHSLGGYTPYEVIYAWKKQTHPTYNALPLFFSLIIGWYYVVKKDIKNNITIIEFLFLLFGVFIVTIISNSRFMLIAFCIINFWGVLYQLIRNKKIRLLIWSTVLLSVVFSLGKLQSYTGDPIRKAHYQATIQGIQENPILGTGLGGMTKYINKENPVYDVFGEEFQMTFNHTQSHNQFLGDWLQTGILGLTSLLVMLGYLLVYGIRKKEQLLLINLALLLLLMNIEMPLVSVNGVFYFTIVFVLLTKRESIGVKEINLKKIKIK